MLPGPGSNITTFFLQEWTTTDATEIDVALGVGGSAVGAFLSTVLVGAILVALAPEYVEGRMDDVVEDPIGTFVYGLLVIVALVAVTILLVITIVGILVVVPLLVAAVIVWASGAAIAFLAIADRLLDHEDGWLVPLLVAGAINGGLALTGIGGLFSFFVGAAGFGAVLRHRFG